MVESHLSPGSQVEPDPRPSAGAPTPTPTPRGVVCRSQPPGAQSSPERDGRWIGCVWSEQVAKNWNSVLSFLEVRSVIPLLQMRKPSSSVFPKIYPAVNAELTLEPGPASC